MSKKEMYEEELERRIRLLENGESMSNAFMQKKDYIWVAVLCGVCLAGIIEGAFMDEYGTLCSNEKKVFIPDWYEWERRQVIEEIEAGAYRLDIKVEVDALPNAKNFIPCGEGKLHHGEDGFKLTYSNYETGKEDTLKISPRQSYSVHTEYDYRGKGQCITLSTVDQTLFLFPCEEGFNATKIQFATEYLYEREIRSL